MITLVIILLLILAFRYGWKRGLLMTLLNMAGYIIVFLIAIFLSKPLGRELSFVLPSLWKSSVFQGMFYDMLAFWIVAIVGGIIYRVLARTVNGITKLPLISQVNALVGALLSTVMMYIIIFFVLLLMSVWPNQSVKASVRESTVAEWILKKTPIISHQIINNHNSNDQF